MGMKKQSDRILSAVWLIVLVAYWGVILCINFSRDPSLYCTDMYSDMMYAAKAWEEKTLFPQAWIFGNQLYVIATPALASLFYGITGDPCVAMGIAATLTGMGVMLSFCWMMMPFFPQRHKRLAAAVVFMTVMLLGGDPVNSFNGWQLLFTLCSYYACYAVTAFLAFGCYLRSYGQWSRRTWAVLAAACAASFGTGIQSLRQTAVMILPLLAVEAAVIIFLRVTKRKHSLRSVMVVGLLSAANMAGLIFSKMVQVQSAPIYGSFSLDFSSAVFSRILPGIMTALSLFAEISHMGFVVALLFAVTVVYALVTLPRRKRFQDHMLLLFILLVLTGAAVVYAISLFSTMQVRGIYYFLLYPLTAVVLVDLLSRNGTAVRLLAVGLFLISSVYVAEDLVPYARLPEKDPPMAAVSDCLEEHGITTVYTHWNLGEQIAIASDFRITAGFWHDTSSILTPVRLLCDPAVFDEDPSVCAHAVHGADTFRAVQAVAADRGATLTLLEYFPQLDLYVFTSDIDLI